MLPHTCEDFKKKNYQKKTETWNSRLAQGPWHVLKPELSPLKLSWFFPILEILQWPSQAPALSSAPSGCVESIVRDIA